MLRLIVTFCLFVCALSLECPSRFEKADSEIPFLYDSYYFEVDKKFDDSTQEKGYLKQKKLFYKMFKTIMLINLIDFYV